MKRIFTLFLIGGCLFLFFTFKNAVFKFFITKTVRAVLGVDVSIGHLDSGFFTKQFIHIKDLKVFNPPGYPEKVMLDVPEVYIDFRLKSLMGQKMDIHELRLNLQEFYVIKNEKGKVNVQEIKLPEQKGEKKDAQIKSFQLQIAKVIYKDYSKTPFVIKEYPIYLSEKFSNVYNLAMLSRLVVVRAVTSTTIRQLANLDIQPLQDSVAAVVATKEVIGGVLEQIKRTTESLKSKFQSIFQKQ